MPDYTNPGPGGGIVFPVTVTFAGNVLWTPGSTISVGGVITNSLTALANPGGLRVTTNSGSVVIQDSSGTKGLALYAAYGGSDLVIQGTGGSPSAPIGAYIFRDDYVSSLDMFVGTMGLSSGTATRIFRLNGGYTPTNGPAQTRILEIVSNTGGATPTIQDWQLIGNGPSRQLQLYDATNGLRVFTVDPVAKMLLGSPSYSGLGVPTVTILTSGSGTYTPPSGARALKVLLVGGGGGGGGGGFNSSINVGGGGGGGAGAALLAWIPPSAFVGSYSYAVGAGGAGGAAQANGGGGGNTTFSWTVGSTTYTLTAGGGGGGLANIPGTQSPIGGAGGTASATVPSTVKAQGFPGAGGAPSLLIPGNIGATIIGPSGGNSLLSGAGGSNGANAQGYGSGGAGGSASASGAGSQGPGGAGAPGIIIIEEYY